MKERGFTLLEVLVASLIMAIAVTGLLSALSTSLRNASRLTDYDRAVILARQKMDELILAVNIPDNVPVEGVWDQQVTGGTPTGYRAVITAFEVPPGARAGAPILERVQLEVWWTPDAAAGGGRRKTFQLEGYRQGTLTAIQAGAP